MTENAVLFVKFGGSLITKKDEMFTINYNKIREIIKEINDAKRDNSGLKLLIGHGGGSFPHPIAKSFNTIDGMVNNSSKRGFVLCQNAASTLNRIFVDLMVDYDLNSFSVQTSAAVVARDGKIDDFFIHPIRNAISLNIIPIVYGDCVLDTIRGFTVISTEQILSYLSKHIRPSRVLIFGIVNGIYTSDPLRDRNAKRIPEIRIGDLSNVNTYLAESHYVDATGGMLTKVEELINIAKLGVECEILGGEKGYIRRALSGEKGIGTIIKR